MKFRIIARPPEDISASTPSNLFNYLRKIAGWTNQNIIELIDEYKEYDLIDINTVKAWGSKNSIPSGEYRDAFLRLVQDNSVPQYRDIWLESFVTCWARFAEGMTFTQIGPTKAATKVLDRHKNWINEIYSKPIMGEDFSIDQIYVPLKLIAYGVETGLEERTQIFEADILTRFAANGFQEKNGVSGLENSPSWVFIKGGPGSGKSVLALSMAQELTQSETVIPIFTRLNRSLNAISFDLNSSPEKMNDQFDILSYLSAFKSSKHEAACLIIDGLDEIGRSSEITMSVAAEKLINLLDKQILECRLKHKKALRIVVFGREIITESTAKNLPKSSKLFSIGNLANRFSDNSMKDQYGDDLRPLWWEKFLLARGARQIGHTPKFLSRSTHSLYELGKEPLLAYLITLSAFPPGQILPDKPEEVLDKKVDGKNRNKIYEEIIDEVLSSKRWRVETNKAPILPYDDFLDILKHIALATWQNGNSRSAKISGIREAIGGNERLNLALDRLLDIANSQVRKFHSGNLITTFYYRLVPRIDDALEDEFEFIHKTFSEYLLAILLFDHFELLIDAEANKASDTIKLTAVRKWLELTIAGSETHDIAKFIMDEAELRWDKKTFDAWCKAFEVIDFILARKSIGFETDAQWRVPYSNIETYSRSVEFVHFFWAALNSKNCKETNEKYNIADLEMKRFSIEEISRFQRPMFIDVDSGLSNRMPTKIGTSFLGYSLSGQVINAEDLTGSNFQHGHIYNSEFSVSHFIGSMWQGTILEDSKFDTVTFIQSMLSSVNCRKVEFEDCDFDRAWFEGTVFDYSSFSNCSFRQVLFYDCIFNHCDFMNTHFENCHFVKCRFHFPKPFDGGMLTERKGFLKKYESLAKQGSNLKLPRFINCLFETSY